MGSTVVRMTASKMKFFKMMGNVINVKQERYQMLPKEIVKMHQQWVHHHQSLAMKNKLKVQMVSVLIVPCMREVKTVARPVLLMLALLTKSFCMMADASNVWDRPYPTCHRETVSHLYSLLL